MFKAIQKQTGEEIIILHPRWRKRIDSLRQMDHADLLVCQGCGQPLRVKAGELKRAHFAHKHLQACSFGVESPEILQARAVLYEWLLPYFGEKVTVEKSLPDSGLPRPVDCWVETTSGTIAYWIIEAGIKIEPRMVMKAAFEKMGVHAHWVFLRSMLHEERKEFHSLLLSPTERAFLKETPFDALFGSLTAPGRSIHYLDADTNTLITYRGLSLIHRPNWYKGQKKENSLANIRASMADGEFLYPGETARLQASRQKKARLEEKRRQYVEREKEQGQLPSSRPPAGWGVGEVDDDEDTGEDKGAPNPKRAASAAAPAPPLRVLRDPDEPEALPCATCGQVTTEYWSTFFDSDGRKLCRCRECLERENQSFFGS